jgi:hypothetical protein
MIDLRTALLGYESDAGVELPGVWKPYVEKLESRVAELERINEEKWVDADKYDNQQERIAELEAENKRLRKAAWAMTEYLRKMHMSEHLEQLTASLHAVLEQGDV